MSKTYHNTVIIEYKNIATHCYYCETPFDENSIGFLISVSRTIDHFVPLCHKGLNINKNKVICCGYCNHLKNGYRPTVFLDKLEGKDKRWARWKGYENFFTKEKLKTIHKNISYLFQLQLNKKMNSPIGYYICKEKEIPVSQRIYKPLTQWLMYGQK